MNLIACVDSNWAISNKGEILVSIPADKKLFKELTDGKVVVGDRRTMESIPGGTTLGGQDKYNFNIGPKLFLWQCKNSS